MKKILILLLLQTFCLAYSKQIAFPKGTKYVDYNGLKIIFNSKKVPICPLKWLPQRNAYDFTMVSRFRHFENCFEFWICGLDNVPRRASCPAELKMVFNPETELCE